MHLTYKILIIALIAIFSIGSVQAQTTINLGCQNSSAGPIDLDRKDWNNGSLSLHSEGIFLNFDLPATTGDCMKITEVIFTLNVNSWDASTIAPGCAIDFYLNAYAAPSLDFAPASVPTSFEALPPLFEPDLFDHTGHTITCTDLDLPFDGQFGVDVIVRSLNSSCTDPQMLVSTGQVTMDYDVCVEVVIDVAGSAEILPVSNGPDLCLGEDLILGENGLGNTDWSWSGPNGFSSTDQSPTYTLSDPSDFDDYTLIVTDADGCTAEETITIGQLGAPNSDASAVNITVCPGQTIELLETGGDATMWSWMGPGGYMSSQQNPTIPNSTPGNLGDYTVVVTDGNGCTSESIVNIGASTDLTVDVTAVSPEVCPGQDIFLEENGNEGDTWNWTGPSFSSTDEDPVVANGAPGLYEVTVTDSNTGCSNTGSINITAGTAPVADADLVETNVCVGQPIELLGSGGTNFSWEGPPTNSFSSTDQDPEITVSTNDDFGIYTVTVTDANGCSSTDEVEVFLLESPSACISGSGDICDAGCGPGNPFLTFEVSPSSSALDIELQFSGTGIPNYTLFGIQDGEFIIMCGDPDPGISDADFDGTNLILPTNGIANGDNISIQIVSVVDPANPTCIGTLDPTCIAEYEYQEAISPNIEYNGNILQNGDLISCEDNFDPELDDNVSGMWLLDNASIVLPFDLTSYPSGSATLAFVPDAGECALFVEVDFENEGCSCMITDGGLIGISCNENNTPSDDTDDYITFNLNPQVTNGGSAYDVSVSSGTVTPTTANYGIATTFQLDNGSAGAGDVTITIIDATDPNCTFDVLIADPGSCSGSCNITSAVITNVECNDFLTGADDSDDFIIYEIEVLGTNTSATYTIASSFGTEMGDYGVVELFSLPAGSAGAGDVTLTVTDNDDPNCTFDVILTDPGTCSGACNIVSAVPTNISCNDNGTPDDDTDDFITFDLDPQGDNLSGVYNLSGADVPAGSQGTFGSISSFSTNPGTAGTGQITLGISSILDPSCDAGVILTDPGTCSGTCNITSGLITNVVCVDAGTPDDAADDIITFELLVSGTNLGSGYSITTPFNILTGTYDVTTGLSIPGAAGGGDITLTLVDDDDPNCTFDVILMDPGSCSEACEITSAMITGVECLDLGTPNDPSDDFILFDIIVEGINTGASYTITNALDMYNGNFGELNSFGIPGAAGQGDLMSTIVDDDNPNCTFDVVLIDPGSCSDACTIIDANISNITCQDILGTDSDDTDDVISFSLDPEVMNGSNNYIISVSSGTVTPNIAAYGVQENFELQSGSAGGGDIVVTIIDEDNVDCTFDVTITDPGSCSGTCNISSVNIDLVSCDDANSSSDDSDDFLIFDIEVLGSNTSSGYTITSIFDTQDGAYGEEEIIILPEGSASVGDIDLVIIDNDNPSCTFDITITNPGNCSDACELLDLGESNISCQDNGTDTDDTDDFITFSLDPQVTNGSTGYTVSVSSGTVTPNAGDYGSAETFTLEEGTAGGGDLTVTVFDENDQNCFLEITITNPGSCSGSCNITDAIVTQITCDPSGTSSDPADDFITFDIEVMGSNTSTGYTLTSSLGNESGSYGTNETFSFPQGSAGAGDIQITITDNDDPSCTFDTIVTDPGSCSDGCDIVDIIVDNIVCNNNGTDDDDTDDFFTFEIEIQGSNLDGDYTLTGAGLDASIQETFGGNTDFATLAGTAGQGDINIELTSLLDSDCNFSFTVGDPGVCSIDCTDPGNCDDGDCTNGLEFWDDQLCDCVDADAPDCDNGTLVEMPCDDLDPNTENDVMFVEECTESVCIPCEGTLMVPSIFIPNVFTPNGDGDHDELNIYASDEVMVEEFSVYDRWGEILFTRENVLSSDSSLSWDGRFDGQMVMPGVYVYFIKLGEPFNEVDSGTLTVYH